MPAATVFVPSRLAPSLVALVLHVFAVPFVAFAREPLLAVLVLSPSAPVPVFSPFFVPDLFVPSSAVPAPALSVSDRHFPASYPPVCSAYDMNPSYTASSWAFRIVLASLWPVVLGGEAGLTQRFWLPIASRQSRPDSGGSADIRTGMQLVATDPQIHCCWETSVRGARAARIRSHDFLGQSGSDNVGALTERSPHKYKILDRGLQCLMWHTDPILWLRNQMRMKFELGPSCCPIVDRSGNANRSWYALGFKICVVEDE